MSIEFMSAPCLDLCRTPRTSASPALGARGRASRSRRFWGGENSAPTASAVARRHGIVPNVLFRWRREALSLSARRRCRRNRPLSRFACPGQSARIHVNAPSPRARRQLPDNNYDFAFQNCAVATLEGSGPRRVGISALGPSPSGCSAQIEIVLSRPIFLSPELCRLVFVPRRGISCTL